MPSPGSWSSSLKTSLFTEDTAMLLSSEVLFLKLHVLRLGFFFVEVGQDKGAQLSLSRIMHQDGGGSNCGGWRKGRPVYTPAPSHSVSAPVLVVDIHNS